MVWYGRYDQPTRVTGLCLINIALEAGGEALGSFPSLITVCQVWCPPVARMPACPHTCCLFGRACSFRNELVSLRRVTRAVLRASLGYIHAHTHAHLYCAPVALQAELCKFLVQNSRTEELAVLSLTLRVVFNLFNCMKRHLKVQLEVFFTSVHLCISNSRSARAEHRELALESLLVRCGGVGCGGVGVGLAASGLWSGHHVRKRVSLCPRSLTRSLAADVCGSPPPSPLPAPPRPYLNRSTPLPPPLFAPSPPPLPM
jgi:hypothetical protein